MSSVIHFLLPQKFMICISAARLGEVEEVIVLICFSCSMAAEYEVPTLLNQTSVIEFPTK
jgi:hypothetical protein